MPLAPALLPILPAMPVDRLDYVSLPSRTEYFFQNPFPGTPTVVRGDAFTGNLVSCG